MSQNKNILSIKYLAICLVAVFLIFLSHELAHYLTGVALGFDMQMTLNSVNLVEGQSYNHEWQRNLVSISGPIFTIIQALFVYKILIKTKQLKWYPFLFVPAIMRFMASAISLISGANDEARVSEWLGIGKMTLPIIVTVFLISLCVIVSKKNTINWKINLVTFLTTSIGLTGLVYIDQFYIK